MDIIHNTFLNILGQNLQEVGVLPGSLSRNELVMRTRQLCPHHVSHYLGMDVHDTPEIQRNINLEPGMVVTVEPGVYIREEEDVRPEFRGIGIRIEDDILVEENDVTILTNCPKHPDDLSMIVNSHSR